MSFSMIACSANLWFLFVDIYLPDVLYTSLCDPLCGIIVVSLLLGI